jgi:hypothetical protein
LLFKVHGPITNPGIVRKSDGAQIALEGTIGSGTYLEIDTANRTVKINGTDNALSFVNAATTTWNAFAPLASQEYILTAASAAGATLEVLYRSAYA